MPEANATDKELYIFVVFTLTIFLILIACKVYVFIKDFLLELQYINCEIRRTTGTERKHWLYMRKRLWLSLIPFIGTRY